MNDFKTLPHDLEAEMSVLGSLFISPEKIVEVLEFLKPDDFYRPAHKILFKAMVDLNSRGDAIDTVTIKAALGSYEPIGGLTYLGQIVNSVPTSSNIEYYAKIVANKSQSRAFIGSLTELIGSAYAEELSVEDLIAKAESSLLAVSQSSHQSSFRRMYDILDEHQEKLDERASQTSFVTGTATGYPDFDRLTTGLHEDNLIILAARPAMGKTALVLNIAQNVATKANKPVAIFSLEMGDVSLGERMLASIGMIKSHHLRTGQLSEAEWKNLVVAQNILSQAPLFIDDSAGLKIADIRARARRLSQEMGGLGLIVIDYLQLIQGRKSDNRQQEVSEISRQLKIIAKELSVPVIALSQLSRNVEQRQNKRPMMSDLRESGSIEQDADIVAFLYRDDYYREQSDDQPENNLTELIIKKNRHGDLGTVQLYFHKEYTKFSSVTEDYHD